MIAMNMKRVLLALPPNRDFSRFCGENYEFRGILKKNMNSAEFCGFYRGRRIEYSWRDNNTSMIVVLCKVCSVSDESVVRERKSECVRDR